MKQVKYEGGLTRILVHPGQKYPLPDCLWQMLVIRRDAMRSPTGLPVRQEETK